MRGQERTDYQEQPDSGTQARARRQLRRGGPEGDASQAALRASGQPREPDSIRKRRAEGFIAGPKAPKSEPGSWDYSDGLQTTGTVVKQQVGKLRPGETGATESPGRKGLVGPGLRLQVLPLRAAAPELQVLGLGVWSRGPGAHGGRGRTRMWGGQRKRDPDVGALRRPDPGQTTR